MPNSTHSLSWANTECTIQIIYISSVLVCVCWANIISACVFEYLWIMQRLTHPSRALRWLRSSDSLSTRPKWISTSCCAGTPTPSARDHFSCTQIQTHPTTDYQPKRISSQFSKVRLASWPVWRCSLLSRCTLCSPLDLWRWRESFQRSDDHPVLSPNLTCLSWPRWGEEEELTWGGWDADLRRKRIAQSRAGGACPDDSAESCVSFDPTAQGGED